MDQYGHEMSVSKYIRVYVTNSTYSIASTATGSRRSFGGGGRRVWRLRGCSGGDRRSGDNSGLHSIGD